VKSLAQQIEKLEGLSEDLNSWEKQFVRSVVSRTRINGRYDSTRLSEEQAEKVDQIYAKHFPEDE
jgi:hypothetical protein